MGSDYLRVVGEVMGPAGLHHLPTGSCPHLTTTVTTGNTFLLPPRESGQFLHENPSAQLLFLKTKPCFDE